MPDEPDDLVDAVAHAEDAFTGQLGRPDYEDGLDPNAHDPNVIQLRKACRLLDACRLLRKHDGYHTSVIEMSFAAIERTLEFYALTASNDTIDDFREGHDRAYDRGADLHLVTDETARRMKQLYRDNRAAAYYRETVAAAQQADAMFDLAVAVHDYVKNFAQLAHECRCQN
ncbi:DNA-binding protein [Natrarchaeobius oligotrophus]|uniref:DNA-binding protein n=1 Tax=Natrarchaeobius chitinivorans TaxID=1679083 RepID=A0A3N6M5R1_NATCH|nr:DNA-binding protein [Natrarchaeobius chitinivorans]RQG97437.1 DNA-binding protein [Natrarchaeobius chitinivorans]